MVAGLAWLGVLCSSRTIGIYGEHSGVTVQSRYGYDVFFGVGTGWPSRDWMSRMPLRVRGEGSDELDLEELGFGIGCRHRWWNGNTTISVRWCGVTLPGPYCLVVAVAPAVERVGRRLRVRRKRRWRERRWVRWGLQCPHCAYDLRASTKVCPECGVPIPSAVLAVRARRERAK